MMPAARRPSIRIPHSTIPAFLMMTPQDTEHSVDKKALQINLDATKYGTFAEIGAGQEVARQFFHVGGASGTIAKTISAYDMTFSDAIYGPTPRYVSRQRLGQMLEYEYKLLIDRLGEKRAGRTSFFAFANTVAAKSLQPPEREPRLAGHPLPGAPARGSQPDHHPRADARQGEHPAAGGARDHRRQPHPRRVLPVPEPGKAHRRAARQPGHRPHPGGHDQVHRARFPLHRQPADGAATRRAGPVRRGDVHGGRRGRARGRVPLQEDRCSSSAAASGR